MEGGKCNLYHMSCAGSWRAKKQCLVYGKCQVSCDWCGVPGHKLQGAPVGGATVPGGSNGCAASPGRSAPSGPERRERPGGGCKPRSKPALVVWVLAIRRGGAMKLLDLREPS